MRNFRSAVLGVLALLGVGAFATEANATKFFECATFTNPVTISAAYDPFTGAGLSNIHTNVTFHPGNGSNGVTEKVDLYFTEPAGSPAFQILSGGVNVLYMLPAVHPLSYTSPPSGTVFLDFVASSGGPITVPLDISIPPGLDLAPGQTITFDARYVCSGSDTLNDVDTPNNLNDVITLNLFVLSALQASYSGPALDFGEIGAVTLAQAPSHSVSGNIRVASSGPYTVDMTSGAAQPYRMTYPGGSTATGGQYVPYKVKLLGHTVDNASPVFTQVQCVRAGLSGQNLPITATLEDGGVGKTASPTYSDTLNVTITPVVTAGSPQNCPAL